MSLSEKDEKYRQSIIKKEFTILATKEDMVALKQIMDDVDRMFNVDLSDDGDLPQRITISKEIDPEAVMYPRVAQLLRDMSKKFNTAAETVKPVSLSLYELPIFQKQGTRGEQIIGVMDNILHGNLSNRGNIPAPLLKKMSTYYKRMIVELDGLIANPELEKVLSKADLQWTYIQNLDTHTGAKMTNEQKLSIKTMLEADRLNKDYPSDVHGYSQAYVAMLRCEHQIPFDAPTHIDKVAWKGFLRDFDLVGKQLDYRYQKPPKTMRDVMNFIFAYSVGTVFKMDNAVVAPFASDRESIEGEIIKGRGDAVSGSGLPDEVKGFKYLYKGIVLGTGKIRLKKEARDTFKKGKLNLAKLNATQVPGFFI